MSEEQIREIIREELSSLLGSDRYTFQKHLQIFDGRNIQVGQATGTKIGLDATSKLSVYGVTPIIQGVTINDPTGGAVQDAEARSRIVALIDRLQAFGIIV